MSKYLKMCYEQALKDYEALQIENEQLKKRIKELENEAASC